MQILITGGTGYIGRALCARLQQRGDQVTVLTRQPSAAASKLGSNCRFVAKLDDIAATEHIDAVINLAGEPIADRSWTAKRKELLEKSRIGVTQDLLALMRRLKHKPTTLISGSAVGYYGDCGDNIVTEFTNPHDEFSHRLCAAWEMQALRAKAMGTRVCVVRTGVVVGPDGGFLGRLLPVFRLGLGGRLGDGSQWFSWIHRDDYVNLLLFLLDNESLSGLFNGTAPNPVTNRDFTKIFAKALHRPAFFHVPAWVLRKLLGELSGLLLTGQRVIPKNALAAGFVFAYPDLASALKQILGKK